MPNTLDGRCGVVIYIEDDNQDWHIVFSAGFPLVCKTSTVAKTEAIFFGFCIAASFIRVGSAAYEHLHRACDPATACGDPCFLGTLIN